MNRNLSDCRDGDYFHFGGHDGDRSQLPLQGPNRQANSSLGEKVRHQQSLIDPVTIAVRRPDGSWTCLVLIEAEMKWESGWQDTSAGTENDELSSPVTKINRFTESNLFFSLFFSFILLYRYMLKSNVGRFNDHHQKRPTAHYQAFEEAAATAGANAPVVVQSGNCLGNGCRHKSVMSSSSASRENIPSAEFMHSGGVAGDGVADNYRGLPNTASSVSTIPMTLSTSANPQSFRLRVAEYSEERKRSFVRLSRKYRQAQQSKGAQVRKYIYHRGIAEYVHNLK